jgi:hypothetical protein
MTYVSLLLHKKPQMRVILSETKVFPRDIANAVHFRSPLTQLPDGSPILPSHVALSIGLPSSKCDCILTLSTAPSNYFRVHS